MKKYIKLSAFFMVLFVPLFFTACQEGADEQKIETEKDDLKTQLNMTVERIDGEIDELKMKLDTASTDASDEFNDRIDKLQSLKEKTNEKLDQIGNTTAEQWEEFKTGVNDFLDGIDDQINDILKNDEENMINS